MRNRFLFLLAAIGTICFSTGSVFFIVPSGQTILRNTLLIAGGALLLYFHIACMLRIMQNRDLGNYKKIFWFTIAVCLPVFGGMLYLISYKHLENKKGI